MFLENNSGGVLAYSRASANVPLVEQTHLIGWWIDKVSTWVTAIKEKLRTNASIHPALSTVFVTVIRRKTIPICSPHCQLIYPLIFFIARMPTDPFELDAMSCTKLEKQAP